MDQTHFYSISIWLHDHHDTDADDDDHERTRHNGGGDDDEAGQRLHKGLHEALPALGSHAAQRSPLHIPTQSLV